MDYTLYIQLALKGDSKAFKLLYENTISQMYAASFRITNNQEDTADILQEAYTESFAKLNTLQDANKYAGWLKKIVINKSLRSIKRGITFIDLDKAKFNNEEEESSWYEGVSFETIRDSIQQLPKSSRAVFTLYALEDYKHSEIAEQLNISISTSKTQYAYAKKLLQTLLKNTIIKHEI